MPYGKPANIPCVQLDDQLGCRLFGDPSRPAVCGSLQPSIAMCGETRDDALRMLTALENLTTPIRLDRLLNPG